ncbi:membrane hypothetical protein [metagenome]|uniref:Transglutaminase-like domain-containing protein n=1 Tax=metagenome TaxID=256318 RepID=A0A2P2CA92_9ZZZZ
MIARGPSRGGAVVDSLVVLGTIALILTMLNESFWSRDYLVAGLVPVVFLLGLAWVTRRLQDGMWVYFLVALVAFAPLGAWAALRRPGPWILPTVDTMSRVLGETWLAPGIFVSTLPPVEASGTLMLLPYAIGFGTALPAAWLALGTRRPMAPVIPLVAGLAATIPVAVLIPDYYILRGAGLTVVLVTWAAARTRRVESLVGRRRVNLLGTVAAVLVVALVSGAVSFLVPDNDQTDRVRLRPTGGGNVASVAADTVVPPVTGRAELFRVTGVPLGARVRFAALDVYDGKAWVPGEESPGAGPAGTFQRLGPEITPVHSGPEVAVRVRIRPGYASDWLPMLGELTSLELDYTDGRTQLEDVRYNQATSSAVVLGGVDPRDDYTFTSVLTPDEFGSDDETMAPADDQRQPAGAFLDQFLEPFDRSGLEPLQRVLLMARYLRLNGSVRLTGTSSQDPVDLGLRLIGADRMVATPFQYSAVTALAASRLGVPARVVVGAEPGKRGIVGQGDVLSWVELQFADGTWRTLEPDRYTGVHPFAEDEVDDDRLGAAGWVDKELKAGNSEIKIPKGADIELAPDAVIEEQTDPWRVVGLGLAGLLGAALLALLLVPLGKVLRRARRRRTSSWSAPYVNGWQEVLDAARDRGTPVPDTWSRVTQATRLGIGLDLARQADAAVFAASPADAADGHEFWDTCMDLRRQLVREVDVRHRLWSYLNPASLLAGWARNRSRDDSVARQVGDEDGGARRQQPAGA